MSKVYKTFDDLVFTEHPLSKSAKEAIELLKSKKLNTSVFEMQVGATCAFMKFDNGRYISVVLGGCFYSDGKTTYECLESNEDRPEGYMTKDQVTRLMKEIQDKPEYLDEQI